MWLALHGLHIAMVVFGGVFICVLIQPRRPGQGRRVAELRAAGGADGIVALAHSRAVFEREVDAAPARPRARLVQAAAFSLIAVGLGTTAHRLAEGGWPPIWLLGISLLVLGAVGFWAYGKVRRPWQWAALVTGSQLLLNAGFSAAAILLTPGGASTADWARVLFCYHAGAVPTSAQVTAARKALGPGAASLLPAQASSAVTGVLIWAAIAHFVAAVLLAIYVMWGERSARWCQDRRRRRDVVAGADGGIPTRQQRRLATMVGSIEQGVRRPAGRKELATAGSAPE